MPVSAVVLDRWASVCPMVTAEEAAALDFSSGLEDFRRYVKNVLRMNGKFKMLRAHLEQLGHTPKQAAARIMFRLGWFPGWTDATALAKLREQVNAGEIPESLMLFVNAKPWRGVVTKMPFDEVPCPLPYIPFRCDFRLHEPGSPGHLKAVAATSAQTLAPAAGDSPSPAASKTPMLNAKGRPMKPAIQKQVELAEASATAVTKASTSLIERSLEKAKVDLSDRECWEWAKLHMGIPGLTIDNAPSTWAHNLYTIAKAGPAKFVSDYYTRWEPKKKIEDKNARKKKRHLEDDGRRTIGLVVKLLKEHAERLEKKETGVVVETKPLVDDDD